MANKTNPPSEEQIENLLKRIQPNPGNGFHHRMADQPWNRKGYRSFWGRLHSVGIPALTILVVLLVLGISLFSPSVQAIAQRFAQFFIPAPSDQLTVAIPASEIQVPDTQLNLTIQEAEALAGFQAKIPNSLPLGYTFAGAGYIPERQALVLNYTTPNRVLRITQRPESVEYQSVGVSATVESVSIGALTGEYVSGAWTVLKADEDTPSSTIQANWDPDAQFQLLRWQENDMLFEIISGGGRSDDAGYLTKTDLIALAENLQ